MQILKQYWGLIGLGLFISLVCVMSYRHNTMMRQGYRYTLATVYQTHWTLKAGRFVDAHYYILGHRYYVSADAGSRPPEAVVGHRYLVKYHPPDPTVSEMYLEAPAPSYFTDAVPDTGWAEPPFTVPPELRERAKP